MHPNHKQTLFPFAASGFKLPAIHHFFMDANNEHKLSQIAYL